jgi:hypothetical protein
MIAECVKRFYDLKEDRFREAGDMFEVTPERFEEINGHPNYGVLAVVAAVQPEPEPVAATEAEPEVSPEAAEAAAEAPRRRTTTRRRKTEKTEA